MARKCRPVYPKSAKQKTVRVRAHKRATPRDTAAAESSLLGWLAHLGRPTSPPNTISPRAPHPFSRLGTRLGGRLQDPAQQRIAALRNLVVVARWLAHRGRISCLRSLYTSAISK